MKNYFLLFVALTLSFNVFGQKISPAQLPFITHYETVYIDGGCSFFNEVNLPLEDAKYQLIISAGRKKTAFIQGATKQVLFNRVKRVKTNNGYIDYYKGEEGTFELNINSISKPETHTSVRSGTLKMSTKNISGIMNVHGKVDEADIYNGYTRKQLHL